MEITLVVINTKPGMLAKDRVQSHEILRYQVGKTNLIDNMRASFSNSKKSFAATINRKTP